MCSESNKKVVEIMWAALANMDWETMKSCMHEEIFYEDVPTDDPGAHGPENTIKRLAIAFDHLAKQEQVTHNIVSDADTVILEHTEKWTFKTGETVEHTFCTVHKMLDGKVIKWSDYWDVQKFVGQFPGWFIEEMMKNTAEDFGS